MSMNNAEAKINLSEFIELPTVAFKLQTQSHKHPTNNTVYGSAAGEKMTISPQNKLSSLTTGAKPKGKERDAIVLPGCTGLTTVIGGLYTRTRTRIHTYTHMCSHTLQAPGQDQYLLVLHLVPTM